MGVDETSEEERELGEGLIRFGLVCTADLWPPEMSGIHKGPPSGLAYSLDVGQVVDHVILAVIRIIYPTDHPIRNIQIPIK